MRINTENNGNCKKGKKTNSHYYNMKKNHVLFKIFETSTLCYIYIAMKYCITVMAITTEHSKI